MRKDHNVGPQTQSVACIITHAAVMLDEGDTDGVYPHSFAGL